MNKLINAVQNWLNDYPAEERQGALEDLLKHGCESGMVSGLIYYENTCAFYEKYKAEISSLLAEMLAGTGCTSPADLFGSKWDAADPLALDIENQNLLAWFAFEEVARNLQ